MTPIKSHNVPNTIPSPVGQPRLNVPYVLRPACFMHKATLRTYARTYEICNRAFYQLETIPRTPETDRRATRLERDIDRRFESLAQDLEGAMRRMRLLMEENSIVCPGRPVARVVTEVPVSTQRGVAYIGLLETFDALVDVLEISRRAGLLTGKRCHEEIYAWQRRMVRGALSMATTIHRETRYFPKRLSCRGRS